MLENANIITEVGKGHPIVFVLICYNNITKSSVTKYYWSKFDDLNAPLSELDSLLIPDITLTLK